jgi:hypothetical protein
MTLRSQLAALERRVGAGDRETISHPQHASAHDDVACAACGALVLAATHKKSWIEAWAPVLDDGDDPTAHVLGAPSGCGSISRDTAEERAPQLGPIQPWDVKDFLRPDRGRAHFTSVQMVAVWLRQFDC